MARAGLDLLPPLAVKIAGKRSTLRIIFEADFFSPPFCSFGQRFKLTFQDSVIIDFDLQDLLNRYTHHEADEGLSDKEPDAEQDEDEDDETDAEGDLDEEFRQPFNTGFSSDLTDLSDSERDEKPVHLASDTESDLSELSSEAHTAPLQASNNDASSYSNTCTKRKRTRRAPSDPVKAAEQKAKKKTYQKHRPDRRCDESKVLKLDFDANSLPVASTGWQGLRDTGFEQFRDYTHAQVLALPWMRYLDWDGQHNVVVCDKKRRGVVNLIGHPRDANWVEVHREAARVIAKGWKNCKFKAKQKKHRRGKFDAEAIGYSHGGGHGILANKAVQRLSGIANSTYKRFCPIMYADYARNSAALHEWDPLLARNFPKSVFAATTINFGPQTVADIHGGELVLWNIGLIIRFPPGCTILFPSALIAHSNLPVQPGEERYSITQYLAAALTRFVENGFQNDADIIRSGDQQAIEELKARRSGRWQQGLQKFRVW
ncbi:hypothetical protein BT96DRAFT_996128 [Gymnopus androsaceus JB14]|uniref:Uncharacterized protein n=1 Tax=Gymnopus androsaceus JB14 TaxID=1447944 RepID=A0A6A4HIX8_9AGAR|nr:hypothetical protein BT96DRAFT_996128 [Gymnopus androsaceus JB14]